MVDSLWRSAFTGLKSLRFGRKQENLRIEFMKLLLPNPKEEQFDLIQHTRKSVVSILSSIAEGSSRFSKTDFRRYIQILLGSLYETVTQLFVALDNDYIDEKIFGELYDESEKIAKMLCNLSRSQSQ